MHRAESPFYRENHTKRVAYEVTYSVFFETICEILQKERVISQSFLSRLYQKREERGFYDRADDLREFALKYKHLLN